MPPRWKQQALIEAEPTAIWSLISDPSRFPEYAGETVEVTGVPTEVKKGSTFKQKSRTPIGVKTTTTFEVAELDELREIKLRCTRSGYYSHWLLTEARGDTFVDLEVGIEPPTAAARALTLAHTEGFIRRMAQSSLDGLRRLSSREKR